MGAKAHDYSGDEDCNRNIKACEAIGIATAEEGTMIRILDKMSRLSNLLKKGFISQVTEESIDDTISDARNYLAILQHLVVERRAKTTGTVAGPTVPPGNQT